MLQQVRSRSASMLQRKFGLGFRGVLTSCRHSVHFVCLLNHWATSTSSFLQVPSDGDFSCTKTIATKKKDEHRSDTSLEMALSGLMGYITEGKGRLSTSKFIRPGFSSMAFIDRLLSSSFLWFIF